MVHPDHEARPGRGHEHSPGHLAPGAADHATQVLDLRWHSAQRQHGDPCHGRQRINDGGDDGRCRIEAKKKEDRHQIGENRYRLHQVQDRRDQALEPAPAVAEDAQQETADHADGNGDQDRGQRHHGTFPLTEERKEEEAACYKQRQAPAARKVAHKTDYADDRDPGKRRQHLDRVGALPAQKAARQQAEHQTVGQIDDVGDEAGQVGEGKEAEGRLFQQPLHEVSDPGAQRD